MQDTLQDLKGIIILEIKSITPESKVMDSTVERARSCLNDNRSRLEDIIFRSQHGNKTLRSPLSFKIN